MWTMLLTREMARRSAYKPAKCMIVLRDLRGELFEQGCLNDEDRSEIKIVANAADLIVGDRIGARVSPLTDE